MAGQDAYFYDVQWHRTPNIIDKPRARDGQWDQATPNYRNISKARHRNKQSLGTLVCKYGVTTGKTCGDIKSKNYTPGSYIYKGRPTFIMVKGSEGIIKQGDSGGPWYSGNTAYGISSGKQGSRKAVYMAINYVGSFGLEVLHA